MTHTGRFQARVYTRFNAVDVLKVGVQNKLSLIACTRGNPNPMSDFQEEGDACVRSSVRKSCSIVRYRQNNIPSIFLVCICGTAVVHFTVVISFGRRSFAALTVMTRYDIRVQNVRRGLCRALCVSLVHRTQADVRCTTMMVQYYDNIFRAAFKCMHLCAVLIPFPAPPRLISSTSNSYKGFAQSCVLHVSPLAIYFARGVLDVHAHCTSLRVNVTLDTAHLRFCRVLNIDTAGA